MKSAPHLVLGTHNQKKRRELELLLAPHGLHVKTLADYPTALAVEETGVTFAENAALKAGQQAAHLRQWVLAEDSGLMVDALGGRPGVYSARYAGPDANDAANNQLLLQELAGVPREKRGAGYACHVAIADPSGAIRATSSGECRGRILTEHRGSFGFGYDPLFEIPEYHRTFGELGDAVKAVLSHRARAMRLILPRLVELLHAD